MWVEQHNYGEMTLEELATIRHGEMAPYKGNEGTWHSRPKNRIDFCQTIVTRAQIIADDLVDARNWRHVFHDDRDSQVRLALNTSHAFNNLKQEAMKLIDNLQQFQHNANDPLLVVIFDVASSLLKGNDSTSPNNPGRYYALNRIISCLKDLPMWFFFFYTESEVRMLVPPDDEPRTGDYLIDPSACVGQLANTILPRLPPFSSFQLDVEDR